MVHSFSKCPLRSSCLVITNHSNQHIVTATDEVLDLLGYSLPEIMDHSIQQCLDLKLSTEVSCIPQCKIRHANGYMLNFQVCIHQDPLGSSSCLDYWLIRLSDDTEKIHTNTRSVLCLSPFGTVEQIQASPLLKQPVSELVGRPVMAFVYKDDVELLCSSLSKLCSAHRREPRPMDPLFIRWSNLPYLLSTSMLDQENSLNYDWMSLTLMSNTNRRPICILQPLQIPTTASACEEILLVSDYSVFGQLLDYCECIVQLAQGSKIYIAEFFHHVVCNLMNLLPVSMQQYPALKPRNQHVDALCAAADSKSNAVWNFIKSNCFLHKSLTILEFTGIFDQQHYFKTCMETVSN